MTYQTDDRARVRRQRAEQAIQLAMESRWEEATQLNRQILSQFPKDTDAYNRLGKALTELGRYGEAREAYGRTLQLEPANSIAKKNLSRLQTLGDDAPLSMEARQKVDPDLFIEETGKTGVTQLVNPDQAVLKTMSAGDLVVLSQQANRLQVTDPGGTYVGAVEPRLALRLITFMKGGNQYAAAIASVSPDSAHVRVIIKETLQGADNVGKLSFPAVALENFRAYTREGLVRRDLDDEETEREDPEDADAWDTTDEPEDTDNLTSLEFRRGVEAKADEEEEFEE